MYIKECFQKMIERYNDLDSSFDRSIEIDAISKILNKSKEEVKNEEIELLIQAFLFNTYNPKGRSYTDQMFIEDVNQMNKYLKDGLSLDEAISKTVFDAENSVFNSIENKFRVEPKLDYIQEYFKKRLDKYVSGKIEPNENLERETVSKILDINQDLVTDEEIYLLNHLANNITMKFDGNRCNNFTDKEFIKYVQNMRKHLENGLSLDVAIQEAWHSPEDMTNSEKFTKEAEFEDKSIKSIQSLFEEDYEESDNLENDIEKVDIEINGLQDYLKLYVDFDNYIKYQHNNILEKMAISKMLNIPIEEVDIDQIQLLVYLAVNNTDINKLIRLKDEDYRFYYQNMNTLLDNGMDITEAITSACSISRNNEVEKLFEQDNKNNSEFKEKYPSLFDENGNLKESACKLLDTLIEEYLPQLSDTKEEEKEEDIHLGM